MMASHRVLSSLALLVSGGLIGLGPRAAEAQSAARDIEAPMVRFFEAWTARTLTEAERSDVVQEMFRFYEDDKGAAVRAAQSFEPFTDRLLDPDAPVAAQAVRNELLAANHFHERVGATSRRLIHEPDPPLVEDAVALRVLSRRDLEALVRLRSFVRSGQPEPVGVGREELERLVVELRTLYGEGTEIPLLYSEAAVLWAGVTHHWPTWTPSERRLAQHFVDRGFEVDMTPRMYQQILGLDAVRATARQRSDLRDQTRMMTGAIPDMATANRGLDTAIQRALGR